MKTKISVEIHTDESLNLTLIDLIGKHNCGKTEVDKALIRSLVTLEKIKYPSSNKYLEVIDYTDIGLSITNTSDRLPFITLVWKEIFELSDPQGEKTSELEGDIIGQNFLS